MDVIHPTVSVEALKGTQSTDPSQWVGLVLSFLHPPLDS